MALILRILLVSLLCYLALLLFVFLLQKQMIYFPSRGIGSTPSVVGLPYREKAFKTSDNLLLFGWLVGDNKNRDVVLHCHGNAGNISHPVFVFLLLNKLSSLKFISPVFFLVLLKNIPDINRILCKVIHKFLILIMYY